MLTKDHFQEGADRHLLEIWVQLSDTQSVHDALLHVFQLDFAVVALRKVFDQVQHLRLVHLLIEGEEQVAHVCRIDAKLRRAVWFLVFLIVKLKRESFLYDESCDDEVLSNV